MPQIQTADRHDVTVKTAEYGESEKGTPFVQINFENAAGDHITGWVYLSDAALKGALKTLRDAFGFDGNFETLIEQITGKPCSITTEFETFDNKERLKVKWINSLRTPPKVLSGGNAFLKNLTAQAARIPAEAPRAAKPAAPKAAPAKPVQKEDEPF